MANIRSQGDRQEEQAELNKRRARLHDAKLRRQEEENKQRRQRIALILFFIIMIVILTVAMINVILEGAKTKPELYIVTKDNLSRTVETEALILRDEEAVEANSTGTLMPYKSEGERVATGELVAQIIKGDASAEIEKLNDLNEQITQRKITILENQDLHSNEVLEATYAKYEPDIANYINEARAISNQQLDLSALENISNKLDIELRNRSEDLSDYAFEDEELNQLLNQKNNIEAELNSKMSNIYAQDSGSVSYLLDDYSKDISLADIDQVSLEDIHNYEANKDNKLHKKIDQGQAAFNLIPAYEQYFLAAVPKEAEALFEKDKYYPINIPEFDIDIDAAKLINIKKEDKGAVLAFKVTTEVETLAGQRKLDLRLISKSDYGLKIPKSALLKSENSNNYSVMTLRQGYVYNQKVKIVASNEDYALVKTNDNAKYPLEEASIIVQNPESVESGEKIN